MSRFFQQLIFFRLHGAPLCAGSYACSRPRLRAPSTLASSLPLPGESWRRGAGGALLCWSSSASPHPTPGSPPLLGAQNMQLLRHPSPHYPITFTPFIFLLFQKTGVRQGKAENFFRSSLGPTPVSILLKTMIYHTILYSTVQYHAIPYGQTITLPSARFKC